MVRRRRRVNKNKVSRATLDFIYDILGAWNAGLPELRARLKEIVNSDVVWEDLATFEVVNGKLERQVAKTIKRF